MWRAQDGVRLAFTSNLVQTSDGYLWLSSQSGLTRFDGVQFRVFDGTNTPALHGRPNLQTYPLVEDGHGILWIATDVGLFARQRDSIAASALDSTLTTDLINKGVRDSTGRAWAITRLGRLFQVSREHGLQAAQQAPMHALGSSMTADASGDIWIVPGAEGVYRVHHDSVSAVKFPVRAQLREVTAVIAAPDASIWFGTSTAVVQWQHGLFRRFPLPAQHARGAVSCLALGADGALWIGTEGAGLYRLQGENLEHVSRANGLSDDRVIDLMVDHDSNIWVATRDGLNRLRAVPFSIAEHRGTPSDLPGAIVRDPSGTVWMAPPTGGLFRAKAEAGYAARADFEPVPEVSTSDLVTALALGRAGNIWIGQRDGSVRHSDSERVSLRPTASGLPPITDIAEDEDETLWIGTWHGLFRLSHGRLQRFGTESGLPDDAIHRLLRDTHGTLWVATEKGLSRALTGDTSFAAVPGLNEGMSRAAVIFEAPTGMIWIGSANGLARVSGGRASLITSKQGLPENWVGAGEQDSAGNLWLGQISSLTRVKLADLLAVADGRAPTLATVSSYQSLDGLPGGDPKEWPHPWSFREPSGTIWFAMAHGIAVVDPKREQTSVRQPITHIEEALIDGNDVPVSSTITMLPSARRIELRYTGVDLSNGPGVQFRYRLDGFDTAWVEVGTQRTVSYTQLPAGHHRFHVASRASNGEWPPTDVATDIVVLSPIYRRSWFLSAVFAGLLFALWTFDHIVLRARIAAVHEERSRMAREIHDSLLQGFGGIGLQLHAASARLALAPEQQPLIDRILALIDSTVAEARGVVWNLRLPDPALLDLSIACRDSADRILLGSGIGARVVQVGRRRRLSSASFAEVLRIVEEALINSRKHSHATEVLVELNYGQRGLRLTVRDNGIGARPERLERLSGHWGLIGMRERARRIGARLTLTSKEGAGMSVLLRVGYARGMFTRPESAAPEE
ncbi:MAG: sensor histidine kinase [Gemmatimonadaceae bacterium]